MPDNSIDAVKLFEEHSNHQVSVWVLEYPTRAVEANWMGHTVFENLEDAVEYVSQELGRSRLFDVVVHEGEKDITLSQRQLLALVQHLQDLKAKQV